VVVDLVQATDRTEPLTLRASLNRVPVVLRSSRHHVGAVPALTGRGLFVRFLASALVALAVVAAVTGWLSRRAGLQQAESDARQLTWIAGHAIVEPNTTPGVLSGDRAALNALDAVVRGGVLRGSLVRTKLWRADGTIAYSDESRLIGQKFELGASEQAVLAGGNGHAEISDLSNAENRFESPQIKLLEVYTRIEGPAGEPLLFEAYFEYATVEASARKAWARYAPSSLAALAVLQLAQVPIVWQLLRRSRQAQQAREELLRRSLDASTLERRRIAGDLHDGVVQDLSGVSYSLSAMARSRNLAPGLNEPIQAASDRVRGAVQGLRSLLVDIYPPNLEGEGLEAALEDMAARLNSHGLTTDVSVSFPDRQPSADLISLLYRGAQEATRNIVKHARAKTVSIRAYDDEGTAVLTIDDDGAGFDPASLQVVRNDGHVGMRVLADLVADFGGTVAVESAVGEGSRVTLEVPLT
jgi:two-component system, NarL family, sensor kinase